MVRPSNPRFMARVLDAVANLDNTKGSQIKDILSFIRRTNVTAKNLTLKVHRALKHAVTAGLLRQRSGRYKVLATLNPVSTPAAATNKDIPGNDQKSKDKRLKPDGRASDRDTKSSHPTQERKKAFIKASRQRNSGRRSDNAKKRSHPSPSTRRTTTTAQNRKRRQRKRKHGDEEFENPSSGRYISYWRDDESPVPLKRRTKRSRVSERELESDFSDESDHESRVNRKPRGSRGNESRRRQSKSKETRAKSRGRSTSRARTPQMLQPRQHAIEEVEGNDVSGYDEDHESADVTHQERQEDAEEAREPNDSKSGSILENS